MGEPSAFCCQPFRVEDGPHNAVLKVLYHVYCLCFHSKGFLSHKLSICNKLFRKGYLFLLWKKNPQLLIAALSTQQIGLRNIAIHSQDAVRTGEADSLCFSITWCNVIHRHGMHRLARGICMDAYARNRNHLCSLVSFHPTKPPTVNLRFQQIA